MSGCIGHTYRPPAYRAAACRATAFAFPPTLAGGYNRGMAVALMIFGVAFGAFCVGLVVQIINRGERWAKRTLAGVIALPALYVVSFGPVCWCVARLPYGHASRGQFEAAYWPIGWI